MTSQGKILLPAFPDLSVMVLCRIVFSLCIFPVTVNSRGARCFWFTQFQVLCPDDMLSHRRRQLCVSLSSTAVAAMQAA